MCVCVCVCVCLYVCLSPVSASKQPFFFNIFLQVSLATFVTYSLVNLNNPAERLTADKAFVALSLFNILRFPLAMLPMLISNLVQASVSVKRLRNFLKNEEINPNIVNWTTDPPDSGNNVCELVVWLATPIDSTHSVNNTVLEDRVSYRGWGHCGIPPPPPPPPTVQYCYNFNILLSPTEGDVPVSVTGGRFSWGDETEQGATLNKCVHIYFSLHVSSIKHVTVVHPYSLTGTFTENV